jgi:arabinogalactan endo-1,4-beta-galactosidase
VQNTNFKNSTLLLAALLLLVVATSCIKKASPSPDFYLGADLSYVNEMQDCGGVYRENTKVVDPFEFFANKGSNIVRVRLWHTPEFGNYSSIEDVEKTIGRAKKENQTILLDFHYSDNWADPSKQIMPRAWQKITSLQVLGDSVYNYTLSTLNQLKAKNLTPEIVQVGNETNIGVIQHPDSASNGPINWRRNAFLLNKGIEAIEAFNKSTGLHIQSMLHVAQPENAPAWFADALKNQIGNYDWIGLSYYPKWSTYDLEKLSQTISDLKSRYNKKVMIVETGYPYSTKEYDPANNMLDAGAQIAKYPISPEGQLSFMIDLKNITQKAGASGIVYWEPAWISTKCKTQWGVGSHWENAAFFDAGNGNEALPVFKFFKPTF